MALKDFTLATTNDPDGELSVAANVITYTSMDRDSTAYLVFDEGVNHFNGDFTHLFKMGMPVAADDGNITGYTLSNTIGTLQDIIDASGDALSTFMFTTGPDLIFEIFELDGGSVSNVSAVTAGDIADSTDYWFELERDESIGSFGDFICRVYSDAARTTLVRTLTTTIITATKDYRYVYGIQGRDTPGTTFYTGTMEDLDLQETAGGRRRRTQELRRHYV